MQPATFAELALTFISALAAACVFLWLLGSPYAPRRRAGRTSESEHDEVSYLYVGDHLVHASPAARDTQADGALPLTIDQFVSTHQVRYPGLVSALETLPEDRQATLPSRDGASSVALEWEDDAMRAVFRANADVGMEAPTKEVTEPGLHIKELEAELETHHQISGNLPFPVWRQDRDGLIIWANNAYLQLASEIGGPANAGVWPPANIFDVTGMDMSNDVLRPASRRLSITAPHGPDWQWYECCAFPIGEDVLYSAVSIRQAVRAETTLNSFVQTMTATFAHLSVGLALFDKDRKLVLFNPALGDLTGLKPEFLSARPSFQVLLEKLRDRRLFPESRGYKSWRQRVQEIETEAKSGALRENWTLPDGQIYQVTGHPHPDGAIALMIEDKSAEVTLTRRYRREVDARQKVLDSLADAIAVFDVSGRQVLANCAYRTLWGDRSDDPDDQTAAASSCIWAEQCIPSPIWGDFREYAQTVGDRTEWESTVQLKDGRMLVARFSPLPGGLTLASFRFAELRTLPVRDDSRPSDVHSGSVTA